MCTESTSDRARSQSEAIPTQIMSRCFNVSEVLCASGHARKHLLQCCSTGQELPTLHWPAQGQLARCSKLKVMQQRPQNNIEAFLKSLKQSGGVFCSGTRTWHKAQFGVPIFCHCPLLQYLGYLVQGCQKGLHTVQKCLIGAVCAYLRSLPGTFGG